MTDKTKGRRTRVKMITHGKQSRPNIPPAEMEELMGVDESRPLEVFYPRKHDPKKTPEHYDRNEDLDPQLVWKGKREEDANRLRVEAAPIYVQEKIQPKAIIENLRWRTSELRGEQPGANLDLFADFNGLPPGAEVEFYKHSQRWTNRMILGDSLLVMTSLAHKEGQKGKVQCVYMDPPYGISYNSNWQPSTKSTDVKPHDETREPEMIKAFRDTWKNGINSYLSYLRERLYAAHELLTESGSMFLQIGNENVHLAAVLMDEVFGAQNRMSTISYATTSGSSTKHLPSVTNYLLWYAKDKDIVKYRRLYEPLNRAEIVNFFTPMAIALESPNGDTRKLTDEELTDPGTHIPIGARMFQRSPLDSQGKSVTGRSDPYSWRGRRFDCPHNRQWSISLDGMDRMEKAARLHAFDNQSALRWKRYEDEVPGKRINNIWHEQMYVSDKRYVVQTSDKVIQRCMLMTTDPGDLVVDPTCGSGTTASIAEKWGRRWITIDTSRVALSLARARLMGNVYPYYLMQDSEEGSNKEAELSGIPAVKKKYGHDVRVGFIYERVTPLSPKDIGYNKEIDVIWEKWDETLEPLRLALNDATGNRWDEFAIPAIAPKEWEAKAKKIHANWRKARTARQKDIDASIMANTEKEYLYDRPYEAKGTVRVTGPFTMESLSPHRVLPTDANDDDILAASYAEADGETPPEQKSRRLRPKSESESESRFLEIVFELLKTRGVNNTKKKERLKFEDLSPSIHGRFIHFAGYTEQQGKQKRVAVCVGPECGTVTRSLLLNAAREAADMFDMLLVLGFAFEAHADENMTNIGRMPVLRIRINADLPMGERLKSSDSDNLFVSFGEPDIECRPVGKDLWEVEILGVDIFDPASGAVKSKGVKDIACWMIDTNYNAQSFFVRHAYFCNYGRDPYHQLKQTLRADIDKEAWGELKTAVSRPFPKPETGAIAVKAVNHYGDEVIKVFTIPPPPTK